MNSEPLSLNALAKVLGRAKSGLHRLARNGQIPRLPDGKFDLAAVQKALAANIDPSRARHKGPCERSACEHVNKKPKPVKTLDDAAEAVSLIRRVLEEEGVASGTIDYQAARTADLILKARERALKMEIESGRLVEADVVRNAVFDLARQDRDSWQNWPSQIGPLLASELGADIAKTITVLEDFVRRHLGERSQAALRL